MRSRCYNKQVNSYKNYGGRGITICDEWRNNFQAFYEWTMSHGYKEGLTIDRIDVNGNYEPNNCRWITNTEQQNNKTNNILITYDGKTRTPTQWGRELNISPRIIRYRYKKGWSVKDCLFTPVRE